MNESVRSGYDACFFFFVQVLFLKRIPIFKANEEVYKISFYKSRIAISIQKQSLQFFPFHMICYNTKYFSIGR